MKVRGQAVSREHQLLAVTVTKSVNRISAARLVYLDGSASASDFPLSNAATFVPGNEVEILAGTADDPVSLFQGIVIAQSIKVRERSAAQLVVECRHVAVKLTVGRKSACFSGQSDSDILSALLQAAGIGADVESTPLIHPQQVQFRASDWDFLLARAEANGKLVLTNDDKVTVKAPVFGGAPVATLLFGATILEMDAQIDARLQFSAVKGVSWDPAEQALATVDAADPGVSGPGNLSGDDLASALALPALELHHAALAADEAQAWADAAWLKSRMSKVSGRVKCEGIAGVSPGDIVTLSGVGERYSGDVLVTGVRHDSDPVQGWKTHLQFGSVERWSADDRAVSAPRASALLPAAFGLQIGTVSSNEDDGGEHRVRVRLPLVDAAGDGVWARVASLDAGEERGFFFRPEIGDEVVVGFLDDDPRRPVLLGMLHSSAKPPPLTGSDENHEKVYQSREKLRLYFNDETKVLSLETPAGNTIALSEEDKGITIEDQNGNKIVLDADGIRIESQKAISIKSGAELGVESGTSLEIKGGTEVKVEAAAAAEIKGGTEIKLSGASGAELSSTAVTKIKGSQVKLGS